MRGPESIFFVTILMIICYILNGAYSSKYSKEQNEKYEPKRWEESEERQFRSRKANMIWSKALKALQRDERSLSTLHHELKDIDAELMKLKALKHDHMDPFGELEASIDEKIYDMLKKYSMDRNMDELKEKRNRSRKQEMEEKLKAMIDKAKEAGFTHDELRDLETEVNHHRNKMAELTALEDQLKKAEEKMAKIPNTADTREKHVSATELKEMKLKVKEKQKEFHSGVNRLTLLADTPSSIMDSTFTQPKVMQLWAEVLKANFTAEEQLSLKQELVHLERKMNKKAIIDEDMSELKKKSLLKRPPQEVEQNPKVIEKHQSLAEKSEQLHKTVRKQAKDIQHKITARLHSEL